MARARLTERAAFGQAGERTLEQYCCDERPQGEASVNERVNPNREFAECLLPLQLEFGEVAERSNAAVLKTVDPSPGPGVWPEHG